MDEIIKKIEQAVMCLMQYRMEEYATHAQELVDMMMSVFPQIIALYADPTMKDHAEDAKYWPAQLERILDALQRGDDLATVDILYNETRANLIELKGIIEGIADA